MNTKYIVVVGLVGGAVTVGVAYFILAKLVDFQWWWLAVLFGVQFLSVIVVSYVLEQNFACNSATSISTGKEVVDWSSLRKTVVAPATVVSPQAAINNNPTVNAEDWKNLLAQLDQMSKVPVTIKPAVSDTARPTVSINPEAPVPSPAAPATFDFSAIANALGTSAPAVRASDVISTVSAKVAAPVSQVQTATQATQGIDFASLFR